MIVLEALFFILPAYIANSFASLSMSVPILKDWSTPIDFGKSWENKRILGNGKTFRGLIFGTFCGTLIGFLQYYIAYRTNFNYLEFYNQDSLSLSGILEISFLLSFGALLGDIIKSLIKRRMGIKRGRPWPPFDQLDFLTVGILLCSLCYFPGWKIVASLFIMTPVIHLLSNVTAYFLKLKDVWW